jgi:glycosyltransferase involved in cell wall biosynthesis
MLCLNPYYSTTRKVTKAPDQWRQPKTSIPFIFRHDSPKKIREGGLRLHGYFKTGGVLDELSYCDEPLVSIITVVLNGAEFLEKTILSVLEQAYSNIEYIIIDGGSTDDTLNIIQRYDSALDYWVSEKDYGIYDAMNKGMQLASGLWINFMNSGDCLLGGVNMLKQFSPNQYSVIQGFSYLTGGKSDYIHIHHIKAPQHCFIQVVYHQALFYNRHNIIYYDTNYKIISDRVMTYDVLKKSNQKIGYIHDFVCTYDIHGFSSLSLHKTVAETLRALLQCREYGSIVFIFIKYPLDVLYHLGKNTILYAKYRLIKDNIYKFISKFQFH